MLLLLFLRLCSATTLVNGVRNLTVIEIPGWSSTNNSQELNAPNASIGHSKMFSITCCELAHPKIDTELAPYIVNWEVRFRSRDPYNATCAKFDGSYQLSVDLPEALIHHEIRCDCPAESMDRNCRVIRPCHNGGYRAFSIGLRCACPSPYFGELCEHFCGNGERVANGRTGRDRCRCQPFFEGRACDRILCRNGGTPMDDGRACTCPRGFLGKACEGERARPDSDVLRDHHLKSSADVTGTVICVTLLVLLLLSVYVVCRRRDSRRQGRGPMLAHVFPRVASNPVWPRPQRSSTSAPVVVRRDWREFANAADPPPLAASYPPPPSYDDAVKMEQAVALSLSTPQRVSFVQSSSVASTSSDSDSTPSPNDAGPPPPQTLDSHESSNVPLPSTTSDES